MKNTPIFTALGDNFLKTFVIFGLLILPGIKYSFPLALLLGVVFAISYSQVQKLFFLVEGKYFSVRFFEKYISKRLSS